MTRFGTRSDLHVENVATGYLVLSPGQDQVWHLTGAQAEAFSLARAGARSVPDHLVEPMAGLVELGVVETDHWSRRKVLQLGGAAAAATVATVALPAVAAAASPATTVPETPPSTTVPALDDQMLYIADGGAIRTWTGPGDQASTLTVSTEFDPDDLVFDADGVLYWSDYSMDTVHAWDGSDPTVVVDSGLHMPYGVAFGSDGKLYIANFAKDYVSVWDPSDPSNTAATSAFSTASGSSPIDVICGPDGRLYVTTDGNHVEVWDGVSATSSAAITSGLDNPTAMAFDQTGRLFIANGHGKSVSVWEGTGHAATTVLDELPWPTGLAFDEDGNLYLSYFFERAVYVWGGPGTEPVPAVTHGLVGPYGLAIR